MRALRPVGSSSGCLRSAHRCPMPRGGGAAARHSACASTRTVAAARLTQAERARSERSWEEGSHRGAGVLSAQCRRADPAFRPAGAAAGCTCSQEGSAGELFHRTGRKKSGGAVTACAVEGRTCALSFCSVFVRLFPQPSRPPNSLLSPRPLRALRRVLAFCRARVAGARTLPASPAARLRRRMSARPVVGVLALQGSFREHCICLEKAGAQAVEVGPPASCSACGRAAALSCARSPARCAGPQA